MNLSPKAAAEFLAGAIRSDNLDALHRLLFEDKVDPNLMHGGDTMLHFAAKLERDRAITMLLQAGADVHKMDGEGKSVLRAAMKVGHEISVKKLIEAGADPTAAMYERDLNQVLTDAELAHRYGHQVAQPVYAVVERFLVNKAAREKGAGSIEALLQRGQPPDTFDRLGKTALVTAVEGEFPAGIVVLLKYKANPNLAAKNGWTPMHFAAAGKDPAIIAQLFAAGAKVNAKNFEDETPLDIAIRVGNRPVIDAVRKYLLQEEMNFAASVSRLTAAVEAPQRARFAKRRAPTP